MVLKHREKTTFHLPLAREEILRDYRIAFQSRQASVIGRREVLSGKAKFGIFGDGKELAQIAMAKVFRKGDFRSGYYRDQTLMFALGAVSLQEFFAAGALLVGEPAVIRARLEAVVLNSHWTNVLAFAVSEAALRTDALGRHQGQISDGGRTA